MYKTAILRRGWNSNKHNTLSLSMRTAAWKPAECEGQVIVVRTWFWAKRLKVEGWDLPVPHPDWNHHMLMSAQRRISSSRCWWGVRLNSALMLPPSPAPQLPPLTTIVRGHCVRLTTLLDERADNIAMRELCVAFSTCITPKSRAIQMQKQAF